MLMPGLAAQLLPNVPIPGGTASVLLTHHGTAVYFDPATQALRHAPIVEAPLNLRATVDGPRMRLWYCDGVHAQVLADFGPAGCMVAAGVEPVSLRVIPQMDGQVALSANGRFMCAESDGRVAMSRLQVAAWEQFLPVPENHFARLRFFLGNRWIVRSTGTVLNPADMHCAPDGVVHVGGMIVPRADLLEALSDVPGGSGVPRDVMLSYDAWKMERLSLYRPLAYFVAFGAEQIFNCARLAIDSLFEHGAWQGDVLVITDPARQDFAHDLSARWPGRIHVCGMPAHDVLDYTLARYKVGELALARDYQPLIYIDSDVIADAPLDEALRPVALTPDLHAVPEGFINTDWNYYGYVLLEADGIRVEPEQEGFSTGVLAFRHVDDQELLFRAVVQTAYRYMAAANSRDRFSCYDQPFLNYLALKFAADRTQAIRGDLLGRLVTVKQVMEPPRDRRSGTGLFHFPGGVGNSVPKQDQMQTYLAVLARAVSVGSREDEPCEPPVHG
jgi:hypothetical protein